MNTPKDYIKTTLERSHYDKLKLIAAYDRRTLSVMLDIIADHYIKTKKIPTGRQEK